MYGQPSLAVGFDPLQGLTTRQALRQEMLQTLINSTSKRLVEEYELGNMTTKAIELADKLLDAEPASKEG